MRASSFAQWAHAHSSHTNCSLAGSRVYVDPDGIEPADMRHLLLQLGCWGMVSVDSRASADIVYPEMPDEPYPVGEVAIRKARSRMVTSQTIASELASSGMLSGLRIACNLILEPKSAVFLEILSEAGAEVGHWCKAHECDEDVADYLKSCGFLVEASASRSPEEDRQGALRLLDELRPNLIIDDGANLGRYVSTERAALVPGLIGVAELTTSGVTVYESVGKVGKLPMPVVAANDSRLKSSFDNRHGTGETCVTTMLELLGDDALDGANVCVIGYGYVGEGFARRLRALGARVQIVEIDPIAAMEAAFSGYEVVPLDEALPQADIVASATGVRRTLDMEHVGMMRDGAVIAIIGGVANELTLDEMLFGPDLLRVQHSKGIFELQVPGGPTLRLLAGGNGINYSAGHGNPIEIMDLSFASLLYGIEYLLVNRGSLDNQVHRLPRSIDRRIASIALEARTA